MDIKRLGWAAHADGAERDVRKIPETPQQQRPGAARFGDPLLARVRGGRALLGAGMEGAAVRAVQEALRDLGYVLPRFSADGVFGDETTRALARFQSDAELPATGRLDDATLEALEEHAPAPGSRLERRPDYDRLFADGHVDITIAHGYLEEDAGRALGDSIARLRQGLLEQGFTPTAEGFRRTIVDPATQRPVEIALHLLTPDAGDAGAVRDAFGRALGHDEVVCYLGHARYGTGPDFDAIDRGAGNFVISRHGGPAGHPHPPLTSSLVEAPASMLPGVPLPEGGYQLLYFQACTTRNYLPALRDPQLFADRSVRNTDIVLTTVPMEIATAPEHVLSFVHMICSRGSLDSFETEENARELAFVARLRDAGLLSPGEPAAPAELAGAITDSGFLDDR
jgi:peptidoglycan hydrolase-like protein with peptidoglycan-binding domain